MRLSDQITRIMKEQDYARSREDVFRKISEILNSRVLWWACVQVLETLFCVSLQSNLRSSLSWLSASGKWRTWEVSSSKRRSHKALIEELTISSPQKFAFEIEFLLSILIRSLIDLSNFRSIIKLWSTFWLIFQIINLYTVNIGFRICFWWPDFWNNCLSILIKKLWPVDGRIEELAFEVHFFVLIVCTVR